MVMTRPVLTSVGTASAAALALVFTASPAQAVGSSYVALGDSYSSGVGTRAYLNDGTSCQRSVYAYPSLIAAARGYALTLRACSGATVADVTTGQLSALASSTAYVTLSVGGNDAGFASVLTECAKPGWLSNCNGAIDRAQATINGVLPSRLTTLYASIRAKAPNAKVVIVGYPRVFNGLDCNALTWFSPAEETRLNATADLLNSRLASAAGSAGFTFANPTSAFVGHAVCDSAEWINGLSSPITDSYHPNRAGHASGYTPVVSTRLTGAALRVTAAVQQAAAASADRLVSQTRPYAAQDALVTPKEFVLPDLTTPAARAVAESAGVDLSSRASIDAADRRSDALQNVGR